MKSLLKLTPFLKVYRWHMIVVIFSTLGVTSINLVSPWLIRAVVKIIDAPDGASRDLLLLTGALMGAYALRAMFRFLSAYISHVMAWSLVGDLRVALYRHLQTLSPRYYADRQTGELLTRIVKDTSDIEPLIAHYIPDMTVNVLLLLGIAVILFSLDPTLAALTLIPMPLLGYLATHFGKRMNDAFKTAAGRLRALSAVVQDNLTGIKEIQIFIQEQREAGRVQDLSEQTTNIRLYALRLQAVLFPGVEFVASMGVAIVVLFGGQAALSGRINVEDLVAFILYLGMFYQPVTTFAQMNEVLHVALAGAESITEVLDMPPDVADPVDGVDPGRMRGQITFENVDFHYMPKVPTLHDISFDVEPGHTLALVGPTGAGKSTISALIPRFYDVDGGGVKIDGIDVRHLRLECLRRNVSMVLQDVFLFNGTIRDNIRYSRPEATNEEIVQAAKLANAHEFIQTLAAGYDTVIGERGVKLSGGQKQRLAIARAVLKDAPILILDEATSSVDTQTEAGIQEALQELMKGRTCIIIAHRLSTVRNADLIVVLDEGSIVEMGSHTQLVQRDGLYHRLHDASVA